MEQIGALLETVLSQAGLANGKAMTETELLSRYERASELTTSEFAYFKRFVELGGNGDEWFEESRPCEVKPAPFGSDEFWERKRILFGFGEIFADKKFEQVAEKHPQHEAKLWGYMEEIERYIHGDRKGVGVILTGPPGTLKTTMLWIFAKKIVMRYAKLRKAHPMIKYVRYGEAARQLGRERFSNFGGLSYMAHLSRVEVLMLDDFAPFGIREQDLEAFFEIFDERWSEKRITFVATNQEEEWLREVLPQVKDRWNTSLLLRFDGASERKMNSEVSKRLGMND